QKDFEYLTSRCSLEYFSQARPSLAKIEEYFLKIQRYDDKFILNYFEDLIKEFNIEISSWKKTINYHKLPLLVIIPEKGIRIILEKMPDGTFKSEGKDGIEYFEDIPKGSKFLELKKIKENNLKTTASKMFLKIALDQKRYIIYALIASLSISIFALVISLYSMQVYDRVIPTGGINTLITLSVGALIAIFIEFCLKIAKSTVLDNANKDMDMKYSHKIFDKFLKIRCDALPKSIGQLTGQLQSYASVRGFITMFISFIIIDFPFALFFLAIIALISQELALIMLLFLFLTIISGFIYGNRTDALIKSSTLSSYKKLGLLVETVENAESIKSTNSGWKFQNKWNSLTNDGIDDEYKIKHFNEISSYITFLIQQINYMFLIAMGAYIISSSDKLTMGSLIAISILSSRVLNPFASIPSIVMSWSRAKMSIDDLNNIFKLPSDNEGMEKPINPIMLNVDLVCNDIQFAYSKDSAVLKTKKLRITQGEKIGILGVIGSGKSTLLKVLAGLYKPQDGMISLNGINLHQISREKISQTIGYLPQNVKLFSGTLRDNLILGMIGIKDETIIEASKLSGLINLINSSPQGLDTLVPEGGDSVSSGQRQLIGLTRLIILNPDIWLLDEPTANIDETTERMFLNFLNSYLINKTLVIISHKQSSFSIVNRLIVMSQNEIYLDGSKNDVIAHLSSVANNHNNKAKI
nr:ATP-binding cassette domain-containing protein [Aliarcobacter sp.]